MARTKKDSTLMRKMCKRFIAITDLLERRDVKVSEALGYANQTTLTKVRNGIAFVDAERLNKLALIDAGEGVVANIHWIITGEGSPFTNIHTNSEMALALSKIVLSKNNFNQSNE